MPKHAFTEILPAPKLFDGTDLGQTSWNGVRGPNARIDVEILDDTPAPSGALATLASPVAVELQLTIAQAEKLIRDIRSEIAYMRTGGTNALYFPEGVRAA